MKGTDPGAKPTRVGIVTGLLEEAHAIRPGTGDSDRACPFHCRRTDTLLVACAGIGKVNAAMAASYLILEGCDLLLSVGAAGRLHDGPTGAHWISEAIQHDYGAQRAGQFERYRAGSLPFGECRLEAYAAIDDPGLGLPRVRILTGDCFVEDKEHAIALGQSLEGELIDMETGAVAQVATMHKIPWGAIRAVSDQADAGSVAEFQTNLGRAANDAAVALDRYLRMI